MLNLKQNLGAQPCPMCGDRLSQSDGFVYCNSCGFPIDVDAE